MSTTPAPKPFYYQLDGTIIGPVTGIDLRDAALAGNVAPNTLIANDPSGEWIAAIRIRGLFDERGRPLPHPPETSRLLERSPVQSVDQQANANAAAISDGSEQPKPFYFKLGGEVIGPMTGIDLRESAFAGNVTPTTLVANSPEGEWILASRIRGLFDEFGRPLPHPPETNWAIESVPPPPPVVYGAEPGLMGPTPLSPPPMSEPKFTAPRSEHSKATLANTPLRPAVTSRQRLLRRRRRDTQYDRWTAIGIATVSAAVLLLFALRHIGRSTHPLVSQVLDERVVVESSNPTSNAAKVESRDKRAGGDYVPPVVDETPHATVPETSHTNVDRAEMDDSPEEEVAREVAREFEIAFDRIKDGLERIIEHEMENTPDSIDELTILIQNEPNEFGSDAIRWAARWRAFNVYMLIALAATIATDPSTETQATEGFFEKQRKWELSAAEALREGNGKEYRSKTSFYYALWKLNSRESVTSREQFLIRSLSTEAVTADRILAVYKRLNRRLALQHHASFENLQEDGSAAFYAANRLDSDNRGSVTANNISKPTRSDAPPQGTLEWFLSSNHCKYARANQLIYNILSPQLSKAEVSSRIRLFSITAANAKISGTEAFQLLTQGVDETKRLGLNSMWAVDSAINAMNFKAGLKAVGRE